VASPDAVITCVDCGGRAHLVTPPDRDPEAAADETWRPGDIATYRCEDCHDRWDIVLEEDDFVDDD
jgi:hypothetical protein